MARKKRPIGPVVELGTVIHGTMRSEDVGPALLSELERIAPTAARTFKRNNRNVVRRDFRQGKNVEETSWAIEKLFDALNNLAPEGFYFGSHPGDGSDYGFWKDEE